ncbi:MAG: DNA repair protein RecO [Pseudomonadota bacterium]
MITWQDEGVVLATRPHGETSVIVEVFSENHGRHAGVVRGGTSRKVAPTLQPGGQIAVTWKARLEEHLGSFTVEPLRSRAAAAMGDRMSLAGLNAVCGLLAQVLPEREAHGALYARTVNLLDLLGQSDIWPLAYLRWEQALLEEMGYALDLSACAVTGAVDGLVYVSPKSGRAVSQAGAGDWADRLLPLPPVLAGQGEARDADIRTALETTGYFIANRLVSAVGDKPVTPARQRLLDTLARG